MNSNFKPGCPNQEASARLAIACTDPAAVTAALGIDPDDSWRAGDTHPWGGLPAKFGSWRLVEQETQLPGSACFAEVVERCIRRLLGRIDPRGFRQRLAALDPGLTPVLVLTGFVREFPNIHFPYDILCQIVDLGAEIDEDFYPLPDEGGFA